jgi:integron integrase
MSTPKIALFAAFFLPTIFVRLGNAECVWAPQTKNEVNILMSTAQAPRLLDRVRTVLRDQQHDEATISAYTHWIKQFIRQQQIASWEALHFLTEFQVQQFLLYLAIDQTATPDEQRGALAALECLFAHILQRPLPPQRVPTVIDRLRQVLRTQHYAIRTEDAYTRWVERFLQFYRSRRPETLTAVEVGTFLTYLAVERKVSASTQTQALNALVFFFAQVLRVDLGTVDTKTARVTPHLPTVLSRAEVPQVLRQLGGPNGLYRLIGDLLYGTGLRLLECCRLRVKDLDLGRRQLTVRRGKGNKDRVTMIPQTLVPALRAQIERVRRQHAQDVAEGYGRVYLPDALEQKYPNAALELGWQYLFFSPRLSLDPRAGVKRRHHVHENRCPFHKFAASGAALGLVRR